MTKKRNWIYRMFHSKPFLVMLFIYCLHPLIYEFTFLLVSGVFEWIRICYILAFLYWIYQVIHCWKKGKYDLT